MVYLVIGIIMVLFGPQIVRYAPILSGITLLLIICGVRTKVTLVIFVVSTIIFLGVLLLKKLYYED